MTGNHQQSIKTIVKETKVQIDNLKKNFDDTKWLVVDEKYLQIFGLSNEKSNLNNRLATFSVLHCYSWVEEPVSLVR